MRVRIIDRKTGTEHMSVGNIELAKGRSTDDIAAHVVELFVATAPKLRRQPLVVEVTDNDGITTRWETFTQVAVRRID